MYEVKHQNNNQVFLKHSANMKNSIEVRQYIYIFFILLPESLHLSDVVYFLYISLKEVQFVYPIVQKRTFYFPRLFL